MTKYSKLDAIELIPQCYSYTEFLKKFGLRISGRTQMVLKKWISIWEIDTSHFAKKQKNSINFIKKSLETILVENSSYDTGHLKNRLYKENIKQRNCEMCGQGEEWRGSKFSLILDHINGIYNDNRLENLRILCPNCNATLDTHCGKNRKNVKKLEKPKALPKTRKRKVERPSYEVLLEEIKNNSFLAMGRKYGVSDNAIRKWIKSYEKDIQIQINHNTSVG
jgi:hypothetical protein